MYCFDLVRIFNEFPRFNYYFANKAGIGRIHINISLSIQNKIQLAGCVTKFIDKFQLTRRCSRYSTEFDVNHSFIYKLTMMRNELLGLITVTTVKTVFHVFHDGDSCSFQRKWKVHCLLNLTFPNTRNRRINRYIGEGRGVVINQPWQQLIGVRSASSGNYRPKQASRSLHVLGTHFS